MPTRNVVITNHQAAFIEQLVESGEYQNASEVLREGLRLVEERRAEHAAKLARLRAAVDVGIADSEAGRVTRFESGEELQAHLKSIAAKAIADGLAER
ncbi:MULTISPECIES: type II toxin-antitoxin system ParD family antitoxin [Methylomicrobium]|uniref:Antitoxin ParD n=1 Tax=Methylomicrobium album BG8 TaxID=686340 RepID=H8GHW6_METAL|nr:MULTISPECIES: type II toxin-antitoxin system ParD family antitoxin [Methylomicrobium]EIC28950.1 putative addiction module antidote protein, CC2985 family [Methylomicrobium album BG8]